MIDVAYLPGPIVLATIALSTLMAWREWAHVDFGAIPWILGGFVPGAAAGAWAVWRNRPIKTRELVGLVTALLGALTIIIKGEVSTLLSLQFNPGDMIFVGAAAAWAIYSVMLKSEAFSGLNTFALLGLLASIGSILLMPFALYEILYVGGFPDTFSEWQIIGGIVGVSSLLAFSSFQYGIQKLGASIAGIFLYLLPYTSVGLDENS